jgi:hypothetical protein
MPHELGNGGFDEDASSYPTGPCSGVNPAEGIGQMMRKVLYYNKIGSAWQLMNYQTAASR